MGLADALGDTVGIVSMPTLVSMAYIVDGGLVPIVLGRPRAGPVNQAGQARDGSGLVQR